MKDSVGGLMDEAVDPQTLERIQACIAKAADGAIEAHDLQTRPAGPVTFIQFHLVVPASMTVTKAHDICDRIENALQEAVPGARVTIHVEPEHKAKHARHHHELGAGKFMTPSADASDLKSQDERKGAHRDEIIGLPI